MKRFFGSLLRSLSSSGSFSGFLRSLVKCSLCFLGFLLCGFGSGYLLGSVLFALSPCFLGSLLCGFCGSYLCGSIALCLFKRSFTIILIVGDRRRCGKTLRCSFGITADRCFLCGAVIGRALRSGNGEGDIIGQVASACCACASRSDRCSVSRIGEAVSVRFGRAAVWGLGLSSTNSHSAFQ